MNVRFGLRLARWEGRASFRRIGLYMLSISLGVAALVAVHSFRDDVSRSIRSEARILLGADVRLNASRAFPDSVTAVLDSLGGAGVEQSTVTTAVTMAAAQRGDLARLVQLRAVEGGWPFYGEISTSPGGLWPVALDSTRALVDEAALPQLGIAIGDSILLGGHPFEVRGTVTDLPTDLGFQTAVGPRVWVTAAGLDRTGILGFGPLARYETYLRLPEIGEQAAVETRYEELFRATGVGFTTATDQARDLGDGVRFLGEFLGLVGLGALLLGGVGVGSAIHVFVKDRLTEVAVLRSIGARVGGVFLAYLLQAGALGLAGSLLGAAIGVAAQFVLPVALAGFLPVGVTPRLSPGVIAGGVGIGVWVSAVFALLPLLQVRDVPPLRALRRDVEPERRRLDPVRALALGALGASVIVLSILEAPEPALGWGFAAGLTGATAALFVTGRLIIAATRRLFPARAPWVVRQGYSNLFRPGNQTIAVTLALGFGAFITTTVLQVQTTLTDELTVDLGGGRPNLLLFDVQNDQREGIVGLLPDTSAAQEVTPLVSSRLVAIRGLGRDSLAALPAEERPAGWALRREYRHTFRGELTDSETLVDGSWWPDAAEAPEGVARISVEEGLAEDLGIAVGDRLTWSISGIEIESMVTSLRAVEWEQFRTNFFVVFEPGALDDAPASWVILARVAEDQARGLFQGRLVREYPNVSVLDVGRIQEAIETILGRVDQAIRFLAGFAAVAGLLVLAGALASSRAQRQTEGALLRTLGARRGQVLGVLFSEYLALGLLAGLTGTGLAVVASAAIVGGVFELDFQLATAPVLTILGGLAVLTVVVGLLGSRDLLRRPPLPVLRGE